MKKYNSKLFLVGFILGISRKMPLVFLALVLGIISIWVEGCKAISIGLIILVVVWSLMQQIQAKYIVEHNDDPDFEPYANAMMSDNWRKDILKMVEERMKEYESDDE